MATFPALSPATRTCTPGEYPHAQFNNLGGRSQTVRLSNVMLRSQLRLSFQAITEAQLLAITGHYLGQKSGYLSFDLPAEVWSGVATAADYTPSGYRWRYAGPPAVTDIPCTSCYDVELTLESVPNEGASVAGLSYVVFATLVTGTGSAANGAQLTVSATLQPGQVSPVPGAQLTVAATLQAGSGSSSGNQAYGASLPVTVTLAAGGATGGTATDPYFSSVSLLLHMDGANNSTAFTDSSSNAFTVTRSGDTKISTTQSKFGGAAAYFDGTGDYLTVTPATAHYYTGDFTIELWIYQDTYKDSVLVSSANSNQNNIQIFRVNDNGNGSVAVYMDNNEANLGYLLQTSSGAFTTGAWTHLALTRSGSIGRLFVNGAWVGTKPGWTTGFRADVVGCLFNSGTRNTALDFGGYIDDVRFTKGVARYTIGFTPPTNAFPNS